MASRLDLKLLKAALSKADTEPQASPLDNETDGVRYLYEAFLKHQFDNSPVIIGEIDFDRFDLDEVGALYKYYAKNFTRESKTINMLCVLLEKLRQAKPDPRTVGFI